MKNGALMHNPEDDVAVVIQYVAGGTTIRIVTLDGKEICKIEAAEDIPLGHKVAIRDLVKGKDVIEYGRPIGKASQDIISGAHVHTQNLTSIRWGK